MTTTSTTNSSTTTTITSRTTSPTTTTPAHKNPAAAAAAAQYFDFTQRSEFWVICSFSLDYIELSKLLLLLLSGVRKASGVTPLSHDKETSSPERSCSGSTRFSSTSVIHKLWLKMNPVTSVTLPTVCILLSCMHPNSMANHRLQQLNPCTYLPAFAATNSPQIHWFMRKFSLWKECYLRKKKTCSDISKQSQTSWI